MEQVKTIWNHERRGTGIVVELRLHLHNLENQARNKVEQSKKKNGLVHQS
jgi:hypothetical protein